MNTITRRAWHAALWSRLHAWEPVRYLLASALALAVDLTTFSMLVRLADVRWATAACIGFAFGAITAYWVSIYWVFTNRSQRDRPGREMATFVLVGAFGLLVTQAFLWVGIEVFEWLAEPVRLLAAGVTFLFNYLVRAALLFRSRHVLCESL